MVNPFLLSDSTALTRYRLSPAKSTTVRADLELNSVALNATGDFKTSALSQKVNTLIVNELIVRTYLYRAAQRRSTLIFCVDLDHVASLTEAFRQAGIDARSISSLSLPQLRRKTIEGFGKGEFPVLVNCEVLTEGTDIPEVCRYVHAKFKKLRIVDRLRRPRKTDSKPQSTRPDGKTSL